MSDIDFRMLLHSLYFQASKLKLMLLLNLVFIKTLMNLFITRYVKHAELTSETHAYHS